MHLSDNQTLQAGGAQSDRRKEPRYTAATELARIGWWEGREFRTAEAKLQDISSSGAALDVTGAGFFGSEIWMSVAVPGTGVWVQASVAGYRTDDDGPRRLRLAFHHACPYDVFKAIVWGTPGAASIPGPPAPSGPGPSTVGFQVRTWQPAPALTAQPVPAAVVADAVDEAEVALASAPATTPAGAAVPRPARSKPKKGRVGMVLDWVVPATVCVSMALAIVALVYVTLTNPTVLEPLVMCLTAE